MTVTVGEDQRREAESVRLSRLITKRSVGKGNSDWDCMSEEAIPPN
jgi:hypothetical protein